MKNAEGPSDSQNNNNTSSSYPLPSEFKSLWESFLNESLINSMSDFFAYPLTLANIVQELVLAVEDRIEAWIKEKVRIILGLLCWDSLGSEEEKETLRCQLADVFRCRYGGLLAQLKNDEALYEKIKASFCQKTAETSPDDQTTISKEDYSRLKMPLEERRDALDQFMNGEGFSAMIQDILPMVLYSRLHDPRLSFKKIENGVCPFKKQAHEVLDGFPKDESLCVVVANPPFKGNLPFLGLKQGVLVLEEMPKSPKETEECDYSKEPLKKEISEEKVEDQQESRMELIFEQKNKPECSETEQRKETRLLQQNLNKTTLKMLKSPQEVWEKEQNSQIKKIKNSYFSLKETHNGEQGEKNQKKDNEKFTQSQFGLFETKKKQFLRNEKAGGDSSWSWDRMTDGSIEHQWHSNGFSKRAEEMEEACKRAVTEYEGNPSEEALGLGKTEKQRAISLNGRQMGFFKIEEIKEKGPQEKNGFVTLKTPTLGSIATSLIVKTPQNSTCSGDQSQTKRQRQIMKPYELIF